MKHNLLIVEAGVRYWEDAAVNGQKDTDGDQIPFRDGDLWKPVIDIEEGIVIGWPEGVSASIHYKVCDAGEYWLANPDGVKMYKWLGHYVPDEFLCVEDRGYGGYIIMTIQSNGQIEGWRQPEVIPEDWAKISE